MTEQTPPSDPDRPYLPPAGQSYPQQPYPGQPYPQQYPPYRPNAGAPSKALAITALVLAILGFFVVTAIASVVLAIIVLVRSRDGRRHGKGMAITALIICVLWIVGAVVAIIAVVNTQPERDSSGQVVDGGWVLVNSIRVGDCLLKEPGASAQLTVQVVPCGESHREEAYANFDLAGGEFPGQAEVDRLAEGGCYSRFTAYVGVPPEESELEVVYLRPLEDTWGADTGVTCLVSEGKPGIGSLKNSKQ